jgi:hypothetical protein
MAELYPTKTRLALLRAVLAENVVDGPDEHGQIHAWEIDPPYAPRKVNSRINELKAAGWVAEHRNTYRLTPAGRRVLDGAA